MQDAESTLLDVGHAAPGQEAMMMETDDGQRSVRSIIAVVTTVGVSGVGEVLHPLLGEIVTIAELLLALTIVSMALFGGRDVRERAYRFLRWIGNRPEPPAPRQPMLSADDDNLER
jgi:hypothetical protein